MPYYTSSYTAPLGDNAKPQEKYGYQVEACQGVWEAGSECHGSDDGFFNLGNIQHPKEQERESSAEAHSHGPAFIGFQLLNGVPRGISKMQVAPESDNQLQVSRVTAVEN